MCGRYIQVSSPTLLAEQFDVDEIAIPEAPEADYNVAPRKEVLTIVQRGLDDPSRPMPGDPGPRADALGAWCRPGRRTRRSVTA